MTFLIIWSENSGSARAAAAKSWRRSRGERYQRDSRGQKGVSLTGSVGWQYLEFITLKEAVSEHFRLDSSP